MNKKLFSVLIFTSLLLLGSLISCHRNIGKTSALKDIVVYPPAPDTARIQYLVSISNSMNITGNRSAFSKFILGDYTPMPIVKPYGVAINKGKIFICDAGIKGLEIIDLDKKTFNYWLPKGKGQLIVPLNCFVDESGYLYITDSERAQVVVFDNEGNYVTALGEKENFKPTDVFVAGDKIWITNTQKHCINVYKKGTYESLYTFPDSAETGSPEFLYTPTNICVTSEKVYVSDMGESKIKSFTYDGKFINSFGSYGKGFGQFVRAKGIAVDRDTNIFVVDAGFENVQIFNKEGQLLTFIGGPYKGPGDMWLPAKVIVDYDNLKYFQKYVDPSFNLKYLIIVSNQYGPDKISVYGAVEAKK